jgi:hypothetical protein
MYLYTYTYIYVYTYYLLISIFIYTYVQVNRLKLSPVRMLYGEGGFNMLNSYKVPFAHMWSPHFVPRPKDWPDYVDIIGTCYSEDSTTEALESSVFLSTSTPSSPSRSINPLYSSTGVGTKGAGSKGVGNNPLNCTSSLPYPSTAFKEHTPPSYSKEASSPSRSVYSYTSTPSRERSSSYITLKEQSIERSKECSTDTSIEHSTNHSKENSKESSPSSKEHPIPPSSSSSYNPSDELHDFLNHNSISESSLSKLPIFIGFGSMIIEKPKDLLRVLLQGAALAGVRVIVQAGWTGITYKEFFEIAKEAEVQAKMVTLVDEDSADNLVELEGTYARR